MTTQEKIELLEKELRKLKSSSKKELPWASVSRKVNDSLSETINDRFKEAQVKSALSCIVAKAYDVSNIQKLTENECEDALPFVEDVLEFIKIKRQLKVN